MKKILFVVTLLATTLLFCQGCGSDEPQAKSENGETKVSLKKIEEKPQGEKIIKKYDNGSVSRIYYEIEKDGKKIPHGPVEVYYKDGCKQFEFTYKYGKMNGPYKKYHTNKAVSTVGTYKDDIKVGEQKTYFESGKLNFECIYNDKGEKNGFLTRYNESDGTVKSKVEFANGVKVK